MAPLCAFLKRILGRERNDYIAEAEVVPEFQGPGPMARDPRMEMSAAVMLEGPTIPILAGPTKTKFTIHRAVLLQSKWFRNILNSNFRETQQGDGGVIELPEDEAPIFEMYANWLYTHGIVCKDLTASYTRSEQYRDLFKMYIFGDKIRHFEFMDDVLDAVYFLAETPIPSGNGRQQQRMYPGASVIKMVYENLVAADSPLKRLLVDQIVAEATGQNGAGTNGYWKGGADDHHPEYLFDSCQALISTRDRRMLYDKEYRKTNLGHYHLVKNDEMR